MKHARTLLALLLTSGLATTSAFAGPNGSKASHPHKQQILQKYDSNSDGVLDANEKAAFKADRAKFKQAHKAKRAQKRAAMLQQFDANKNGVLEPAEKQAAIVQRSNKRFDALLVKADTNGDKMLSMAELAAAKPQKAGKAGKAGKARKPGKGTQRFAKSDLNGDGQITRAEFRKSALTRADHMKARRGHRQGKGFRKAAPK